MCEYRRNGVSGEPNWCEKWFDVMTEGVRLGKRTKDFPLCYTHLDD